MKEENFKFGDKVIGWNDDESEYFERRFVAKIQADIEHKYILVWDDEALNFVTEGKYPVSGSLFKNCISLEKNPYYKYDRATENIKLKDYANTFDFIIAVRNAVWAVDNWQPIWVGGDKKECIIMDGANLSKKTVTREVRILVFKNSMIRDWFLSSFYDHIHSIGDRGFI